MPKLAVYLGNVGKDYANTRHNAGFLLAGHRHPGAVWSVKFHSAYMKEGSLHVMKPLTLMNLSGTAVSEAASFFKLKAEDVLVIHDDLELPLGEARYQKGGGLQGHNGLRSIKERLGSDGFWRLRIGIGRPKVGPVASYVLQPFSKDEIPVLNAVFSKLDPVDFTKETPVTIKV